MCQAVSTTLQPNLKPHEHLWSIFFHGINDLLQNLEQVPKPHNQCKLISKVLLHGKKPLLKNQSPGGPFSQCSPSSRSVGGRRQKSQETRAPAHRPRTPSSQAVQASSRGELIFWTMVCLVAEKMYNAHSGFAAICCMGLYWFHFLKFEAFGWMLRKCWKRKDNLGVLWFAGLVSLNIIISSLILRQRVALLNVGKVLCLVVEKGGKKGENKTKMGWVFSQMGNSLIELISGIRSG